VAPLSSEEGHRNKQGVRPFLVTGGRTNGGSDLRFESQIVAVRDHSAYSFEKAALLQISAQPISLAEVSAHLKLPFGTVKVLAADLIGAGALQVGESPVDDHTSPSTIRELIHAVHAL